MKLRLCLLLLLVVLLVTDLADAKRRKKVGGGRREAWLKCDVCATNWGWESSIHYAVIYAVIFLYPVALSVPRLIPPYAINRNGLLPTKHIAQCMHLY